MVGEVGKDLIGKPIPSGHVDVVLSGRRVVGNGDVDRNRGRRACRHVADGDLSGLDLDRVVFVGFGFQSETPRGRHARVKLVAEVHLAGVEDIESYCAGSASRDSGLGYKEVQIGRSTNLAAPAARLSDRIVTAERQRRVGVALGGRLRGDSSKRHADTKRDETAGSDDNQRRVSRRPPLSHGHLRAWSDRGYNPRANRRATAVSASGFRRIESYVCLGVPPHKRVE